MQGRAFSRASMPVALLVALSVLWGSHQLAESVKASRFYRQSHMIRLLLSQDAVGMRGLFSQRRNTDILLKFTGALTGAAINFEMIPVGEASTLMAVLQSLRDDIHIEGFVYSRRNLTIYGVADSPEAYRAFVAALRGTGYFASVFAHAPPVNMEAVFFSLVCTARPADD